MSQGNFGDNDDVDDAFLEELMNTDIDVQGGNEEDEAAAVAAVACTLPVIDNIWECPMLRKFVTMDNSGKEFTGWSCGWSMCWSPFCNEPHLQTGTPRFVIFINPCQF